MSYAPSLGQRGGAGVVSAGTDDAPEGFDVVSGGSNLTRLVLEARNSYP